MSSEPSLENPFRAWEDLLRNDPFVPNEHAISWCQVLALIAATIHLSRWIKQSFPLCLQMWKHPFERILSLPRRWHENMGNSATYVTFLASEIIFLVSMPFMCLFRVIVYVGIPVSAFYGTPVPFFSEEPPLTLTISMIVLWILVLHAFDLVATSFFSRFQNDKPNKVWFYGGRLGLLMAFFGALCFSGYTAELAKLQNRIQYVGPVRLSHIAMYYKDDSAESQAHKVSSDSETEYPYVYASWTAEWGSSWACPNLPEDHWCQARQTACHQIACYHSECSDSEIDLSKAMTRECLNMISLHWSDGAYDSSKTFDRHVSPRQDGRHWPTMLAYANCETCEIYGGTRTGYAQAQELLHNLPYAQRLRGYGIPLFLGGWILAGAAFTWNLFVSRRPGNFAAVMTNRYDFTMGDGDLELEVVPTMNPDA
mmetsp:Transcript_10121/g.19466  ORF Transcript_10121/g.19466 Transcript_10121/m.19466 type:complete len:425 (-) Transcript_10121:61-1335(-)